MPDPRMSMKQFASKLREIADVPADMSDEDLVLKVASKKPEISRHVNISEVRPRMKPEAQPGVMESIGKELGGMPKGMLQMGQNMLPDPMAMMKGSNAGAMKVGAKAIQDDEHRQDEGRSAPYRLAAGAAQQLGVNARGMEEQANKGNAAGVLGTAIGDAIPAVAHAAGEGINKGMSAMKGAPKPSPLESMETIGEGTEVDKAMMDITKARTKPQSMALDKTVEEIDQAMQKSPSPYVDTKRIQAGMSPAIKTLAKISKATGAQVKDVSAAQEAVLNLNTRLKKNSQMSWTDARQTLQQIKAARKTLGAAPSAAKNALVEIEQSLQESLEQGAQKGGQGPQYSKWVKDYRSLSRLQRAGAKAYKGHTEAQMNTKLTAKPSTKVAGISLGRSKAGKVAQTNKQVLEDWESALRDLDFRIKQKP